MKTWTEQEIVALLTTPKAISKAILAIYNRQTIIEQGQKTTYIKNGVGFNAYDSKFGTSLGSWLQSNYSKGNYLYGSHLVRARKMVIRYRKQLVKIANKEI